MSRYRWRGNDVAAAPSPIMIGEMEVIVGETCFAMSTDAFLACFALDEEAVAADAPPAPLVETAVVVIAPVPALPTSAHWSSAPPALLPAAPRLDKNRRPHAPFSKPWQCPTCDHETTGRKCGECGTSHPHLYPRMAHG